MPKKQHVDQYSVRPSVRLGLKEGVLQVYSHGVLGGLESGL